MKTKSLKAMTVYAIGLFTLAIVFIIGCSKENKVDVLNPANSSGTSKIDATIGGYPPTTYVTPGAWKVDKSHSNIMWETFYYGIGAPLTGRFNTFELKVNFDEANPANTRVNAWIQLSTFNTGEPGRDGYGKCGPGYMGVKFDTVSAGPPVVLKPRASTDTAWFNSTSCERYGTGFLLKGKMKFLGKELPIEIPVIYTSIKTSTNATTGKKTDRAGLYGEFGINALSFFGVTSTSIADLVKIRVDCNMVSNPY